jgi:hypothetical protein
MTLGAGRLQLVVPFPKIGEGLGKDAEQRVDVPNDVVVTLPEEGSHIAAVGVGDAVLEHDDPSGLGHGDALDQDGEVRVLRWRRSRDGTS